MFKRATILLFATLACLAVAGTAQAHSISLSWTASTDAGATYNVYRLAGACPATGTAGFTKLTAAPVTGTAYSDGTVTPGTYCYYATSELSGAESIPSNLVSVVILPAPPTSLTVGAAN